MHHDIEALRSGKVSDRREDPGCTNKTKPRFEYLEQFKDDMQQLLEQVSQKENAANLKKELIEEQNKEM